jgi:phosphate transport system protein
LRNNVLMMASLTERSLENALQGLLQRDDDLSATAIVDDEEIDQLEKEIDEQAIRLLAKAPLACSSFALAMSISAGSAQSSALPQKLTSPKTF